MSCKPTLWVNTEKWDSRTPLDTSMHPRNVHRSLEHSSGRTQHPSKSNSATPRGRTTRPVVTPPAQQSAAAATDSRAVVKANTELSTLLPPLDAHAQTRRDTGPLSTRLQTTLRPNYAQSLYGRAFHSRTGTPQGNASGAPPMRSRGSSSRADRGAATRRGSRGLARPDK